METNDRGQLKLKKVILPVVISIAISAYLIAHNFKPESLHAVHFSSRLVIGLILTLLALLARDFCFVNNIRLCSGKKLSWKQSVQTIILWEFGTAITPKLSEVAITFFVLKRNGLSYGRSTGLLILNSFIDNVVFVVAFGILYAVLGHRVFDVPTNCADLSGSGVVEKVMTYISHLARLAWIGYGVFCFLSLFWGIAIFVLPNKSKEFFYRLGRTKLLGRFQNSLNHFGDEIEITANEYKQQPPLFWVQLSISTLFSWTMRFLIVNALIFAFTQPTPNMWDVFARQWVLWIFMVIPTTPGASGWAEISFIALNCAFMPAGLSVAIALIWRIFTYYLYLVLGLIILPGWLSQTEENSEREVASTQ